MVQWDSTLTLDEPITEVRQLEQMYCLSYKDGTERIVCERHLDRVLFGECNRRQYVTETWERIDGGECELCGTWPLNAGVPNFGPFGRVRDVRM